MPDKLKEMRRNYRHIYSSIRRRLVVAKRRVLDSKHRMLPSFIVVGAQKSGTTSLDRYLSWHPDIIAPLVKELRYFDRNYYRGERWYRSHFPKKDEAGACDGTTGGTRMTFDTTPYYIFHPLAVPRMAKDLPHAKIIAVLRNPVDRAYSHYQHNVKRGLESLSFDEAIEMEPRRLAGEVERINDDPKYKSVPYGRYSYVSRGRYAHQIERVLQHFPRSAVHIIKSERLLADPATEVGRVFDFLGVRPRTSENYQKYHVGGYRDRLDATTRQHLEQIYASDIERLEDLLGERFEWF